MAKSTLKRDFGLTSDDFFQIRSTETKSNFTELDQDRDYETIELDLGGTYTISAKSLSVPSDAGDKTLSKLPPKDINPETLIEVNRAVTRRIPQEDRKKLFSEHEDLVRKKYADGLSRREERRLSLLRWELDRIEDAEIGTGMDVLEAFTEANVQFASEIDKLLNQLEPDVLGVKHKKRKPHKKS